MLSDEYLNYAMLNRKGWETKDLEVVAEMVEKVKKMWDGIEKTKGAAKRHPSQYRYCAKAVLFVVVRAGVSLFFNDSLRATCL